MEVARRAGHSVAVLLRVYAKVLAQAQAQDRANRQIEAGLREWDGDGAPPGGRVGTRADQAWDSPETGRDKPRISVPHRASSFE